MSLIRLLRRYALGFYEPASPVGQRVTEADYVEGGKTPFTTPDVIPPKDRKLLEEVQKRHHDIINRYSILDAELQSGERVRRVS